MWEFWWVGSPVISDAPTGDGPHAKGKFHILRAATTTETSTLQTPAVESEEEED